MLFLGPTSLSLNQSDSALAVCGHGVSQEEPVQTDGGESWSSGDRHRGGEHPYPAGTGEDQGSYAQGL